MKMLFLILLILSVTQVLAEDYNRHNFTISTGLPGLVFPELTYEYGIDAENKVGVSAGTIVFWPEYRMNYTRMSGPFELMGSLGFVPSMDDDEDNFLSEIFEEVFSGGTEGCKFVSATGGYRYSAENGFIFRAAAGGALFYGSETSVVIPFLQLGVGFGF